MAIISRGTKAAGGTNFTGNTTILDDEVDTDFNTIINDYNGNITNANVSAAANIAESKIDDISVSATAHTDADNPGDSSSHSLPTDLEGEISQLRYAIERNILGIDAQRVDGTGTGTTGWFDLPSRGPNLVKNPNFYGGTPSGATPPTGWTAVGTPAFTHQALAGATLVAGKGPELKIVAGNAAQEGVSQSFSLKASTRYLVVALVRSVTSNVHVKTTGADAGTSFRNIDVTHNTSTYAVKTGVIQTDTTPTAIVIQIVTNGALNDEVRVSYVGLYECSANVTQIGPTPWVISTAAGPVNITNAAFTDLGLSASVYANDGMQIEAEVDVPYVRATNSGVIGLFLSENVAGGGAAEVAYTEQVADGTVTTGNIRLKFVRQAPTPGSSYVYTASARTSGTLTANLPGATAVTGAGTKRIELRVRSVRVSQ